MFIKRIIFFLFLLVCLSISLNNFNCNINKINPILKSLTYFNLAPNNWGMFTHTFSNAYDKQFKIFLSNGSFIVKPIKGLLYPWRRSVINELEEKLAFDNFIKERNITKNYLNSLCALKVNNSKVIKITYQQRSIPITSLLSYESKSIFNFVDLYLWNC